MAAVQTKVDSLGDEVRHISEALRAYMQEGITGSDRRKLRTPIPKAGRDCLQHLLSRIDQVAAGLAEIGKLASHTSPPPPPARGPDTPLSYHSPRSQAALPVASSPGGLPAELIPPSEQPFARFDRPHQQHEQSPLLSQPWSFRQDEQLQCQPRRRWIEQEERPGDQEQARGAQPKVQDGDDPQEGQPIVQHGARPQDQASPPQREQTTQHAQEGYLRQAGSSGGVRAGRWQGAQQEGPQQEHPLPFEEAPQSQPYQIAQEREELLRRVAEQACQQPRIASHTREEVLRPGEPIQQHSTASRGEEVPHRSLEPTFQATQVASHGDETLGQRHAPEQACPRPQAIPSLEQGQRPVAEQGCQQHRALPLSRDEPHPAAGKEPLLQPRWASSHGQPSESQEQVHQPHHVSEHDGRVPSAAGQDTGRASDAEAHVEATNLPSAAAVSQPPALAAETATSVPDPPSATRQRLQVQQCRPQTPPTPPDQHPESRAPQSAENATQQTCKSPARAEITLSDGSVYVPPVAQEQAAPLFDCRYADINVLREELFEMYSSHPDVQNRGYFKLQVRELPPLRVRTVESPGKDHATSFTYKADHLGLVKVDTGKKMRFKAPTLPFPTSEQTVWSLEQQRELWNASAADPPKGTRGYIIGNPLFQDVELSPGEKLKRRGRAVLEGINTQYVYFNLTGKTITTMHREDAHVRSENLLRSGEHKFWCFVKPAFSKKLEERMATEYPEMRRCSQAVRHLSRHIPPAKLDEWGIEYTLDYCVPGQAVVTEPGTYHQVLNLGPNYALAVNVEYMSSPDDPPDYRFCDKQCPDKHAMSADDFRLSDTRHNLAGQERERAMMMRSSASQAAPDQGRTEAIRSSMAQSAPKKRGRPPKTRPAPERPVSSQPGLAAPPVTQSATPAPEQRTPSARSQPNGESARPFHVQPQPQRNPFQRPEGPGQDAVPIPRMSSATSGSHLPYHHPSRQPLQSPLRPPIGFELPIPPAPPSFPTRAAAAAGAASEVPVLMSPFPPVHHLSRLQHPHMPPAELPRSHVGPDPSPDAVRGTQRVSDVAHYTEHHIPGPPPDAPDEETMRRRSPIRKTARLVRPKRRAPREAPSPGPPKKRRVLECPPPPAPAPLSPLHCDVSALLRSCHAAQAATRFEIPPPEQVSGKPAFERLTRLVQEWRRTSHGPDPMPWGMQLLAYWEASAESDSELPSFLARFCKWKIAERLTQLQQGELERGGREDAQKPVAASADDSFRSHKDQLLQELGWENTPYNQTKLDEYVREGKCWGTLCGSFDGLLCFVPSGASYWELAVFQDRVHLFHSQLESEFVRKMCDVGRMFQNAVWDNLELPEFVFESVDTAKLDTTQILPTLQQYKTIKENVYHMHNAYFWPRPSFWPHIWYWPVDPTAVPPNKRHCDTCKKKSACRCHERDIPDVPRVVVHGDRDLGVRTVGVYTEGAILGELVGELVPAGILPNEWTLEVRRPDSPLLGAVVAEIHTKEMGNWVRFVKHSPNPNCEFAVKKLSGRYRVLLVASRYILPGEEITAKYGRGYRKENPYSVMEGI